MELMGLIEHMELMEYLKLIKLTIIINRKYQKK